MSWPEHCPSKTLGKFQWVTRGTIGWMWLRSGLAAQNDRVKIAYRIRKWIKMVQHGATQSAEPHGETWGGPSEKRGVSPSCCMGTL